MKYFFLLLAAVFISNLCSAQKIELINSGELIKKATTLYDSGQYKQALAIYNKISRNDTNYVWSLYERAVSCEADSQYKQAIAYYEEALSLPDQREYEPDIYNQYGNALQDIGQTEKAISVFDVAIAKYPSYSLLYFNKGVVELGLKRYAEAEALFQKALMINPYMYSAHYQLALVALQQGKIIPAYLCLTGYLLMIPEGKYFSKAIKLLDQLSRGKDEILEYKNNRTINPDENYQAMEDIVLSKIALDKGYKPIISLDDPISRQIQAIFEKLEYSDSNNDFYIQYYLPYYKKLFNEGKFEPFIYHVFSGAKVQVIQDYNKKNKKTLDAFVNEAADYFNELRATRELSFKKRDQVTEKYYFEEGKLVGKGVLLNGKTLTGHWEFYYPAGNIKGRGEYNAQGGREGAWMFYRMSGMLKGKEQYKNGKLEGQSDNYFENGNPSSHESYSNGQLDGPFTSYYYAGSIKSKGAYKQGKKNGEITDYYPNGNLYTVNNYIDGVLTGVSKEYYKGGGIKETEQYVAGSTDGDYKSYDQNGGISAAGQNAKGKAVGEWTFYYSSGKIKEKRSYVNDSEEGLHEEYFENGQVSGSFQVKNAKINGEATYFYKDGKVLSKFIYDNGIPRSVKYFDKAGTQISASEMKNNLLNILSYGTSGFKKARYSVNQKGDLTGMDTIFYPSGKVNQVLQYEKGELNGPVITYHLNGKKKSEINYKAGKQNGYFIEYYPDGKIQIEGWIVDDQQQGEWDYYDEKGRLVSKSYYLDNDLSGYKEEYYTNGKKKSEQKYKGGWLEKLVQFNKDGVVLGVDSFPKGTGKYVLYHPNGKVMEQGNYVNGDFDGAYKTYYFDGSLASSFFFNKGMRDSIYSGFYYGGGKEEEGIYKNGSKTGIWKGYNEEGKLLYTVAYRNDERNGPEVRFFPDGNKDQLSIYKDDKLDGAYEKYNIDGALAYQIAFEGGTAQSYSYLGKDGKLVPAIALSPQDGLLKSYFSNGNVSRECHYSDGLKNGRDVVYYPNGQIHTVDTTAFSISQGIYQEFYTDGKLKAEYTYAADNADGICRDYYPNGTLKKETHYDNGSYDGPVKYFDNTGKLVKTMQYFSGELMEVKNEK